MNVVLDSSVWIEILGNGPLRKSCQTYLRSQTFIRVPTIVHYEVYRKIAALVSEDSALSTVSLLNQYEVLELTVEVSLLGGDLSLQYSLGMADSLILAHAHMSGSTLVTLDNDFSKVLGVKLIRS